MKDNFAGLRAMVSAPFCIFIDKRILVKIGGNIWKWEEMKMKMMIIIEREKKRNNLMQEMRYVSLVSYFHQSFYMH